MKYIHTDEISKIFHRSNVELINDYIHKYGCNVDPYVYDKNHWAIEFIQMNYIKDGHTAYYNYEKMMTDMVNEMYLEKTNIHNFTTNSISLTFKIENNSTIVYQTQIMNINNDLIKVVDGIFNNIPNAFKQIAMHVIKNRNNI